MALSADVQNKDTSSKKAEQKILTVAVVPYAEEYTPALEKLVEDITHELKSQQHVEVRDLRSTQEILQYYLSSINSVSHETKVDQMLRQVRDDYAKLHVDQAWKTLQQIETQLQEKIASGESNALYLDILTLKAKLSYLKGNTQSIPSIYYQIVALNPELSYEHGLYSKWEIKALEQAKAALKTQQLGTLRLQSNPVGSEVYLNGVRKGVTYYNQPLVLNGLPAGEHFLEVKTIHYQTYRKYIQLEAGKIFYVNAQLSREKQAFSRHAVATIAPARFQTPTELSHLISQLGYYLKVDKVILVHKSDETKKNILNYQIGDAQLGAVYKLQQISFGKHEKNELAFISREMNEALQKDIFSKPQDLLVTQSVGSLKLHEHRKRPFHKQPLFWILVTAGAATGGIASVLLGGGAAAATTGGVIISL